MPIKVLGSRRRRRLPGSVLILKCKLWFALTSTAIFKMSSSLCSENVLRAAGNAISNEQMNLRVRKARLLTFLE